MPTELLANSPVPGSETPIPLTTLAAHVAMGATKIKVEEEAPASLHGGQFRIVIGSEIMIVTAGQEGTEWIVTRGAEGSTEAAHPASTGVFHDLTAGALENAFDPRGSAASAQAAAEAAAKTTSEAEVRVERERAEIAEATKVPLTEVGANSGVMGLTTGGIGAQPPAHHASTHAEGGSDPLTLADLPNSVVNSSTAGNGQMPVANGSGGYAWGTGGSLTGAEINSNQAVAWGHAYVANAEAGNLTLKLPAATGNGGSFLYVEVSPKSGANTVTFEANGSEKIVYQGEEISTLVLSLEAAQGLSGVMLIAIANNPRVF